MFYSWGGTAIVGRTIYGDGKDLVSRALLLSPPTRALHFLGEGARSCLPPCCKWPACPPGSDPAKLGLSQHSWSWCLSAICYSWPTQYGYSLWAMATRFMAFFSGRNTSLAWLNLPHFLYSASHHIFITMLSHRLCSAVNCKRGNAWFLDVFFPSLYHLYMFSAHCYQYIRAEQQYVTACSWQQKCTQERMPMQYNVLGLLIGSSNEVAGVKPGKWCFH